MSDPAAADPVTMADLVGRAEALAAHGQRSILGITGAPGAGKSTVAEQLVQALGPERAVLVPMDGFHLANTVLDALGRRDRKGAVDTFDDAGYAALLERIRAQRPDCPETIYAPVFRRELVESAGSALPVRPAVPPVYPVGNHLLH